MAKQQIMNIESGGQLPYSKSLYRYISLTKSSE